MKITHYEFGHIEIDGKDYASDVIITSDQVRDNWWRKEGHNLAIDDLDAVVADDPQVLIIGSGYYGRMQVPGPTRQYLADRGIRVEIEKTADAVTKFNELQKEYARIVAALHLTC
jgi:hypothetical protein